MNETMNKNFKVSLIIRSIIFTSEVIGFIIVFSCCKSLVDVMNTFAYFTNQSNLFVLILMGVLLFKSFKSIKNKDYQVAKINTLWHLFVLFTILVTMLIFTGLGVYIFISKAYGILELNIWTTISNVIFHYVAPILTLVDYIKFSSRKKISYKKAKNFCFYTTIYFLLLVLRAQTHTLIYDNKELSYQSYYPYPFLDINHLGVIKSIISLSLCTLGFYLFSLVLIRFENLLNEKSDKQLAINNKSEKIL